MINSEKLKEVANLQLQLAVLNGEPWAIKQALGVADLTVGSSEGGIWEVEITNVSGNKKEADEPESDKDKTEA